MPLYGPGSSPARSRGNRSWSRRQRRYLRGNTSEPLAGPPGPSAAALVDRGRIRERRKRRRSSAFDLLAVAAALALTGLGLANLYLINPQLAARQGSIA